MPHLIHCDDADLAAARQNLAIRVVNLHKAFGENRVLCGVSLDVRRGEIVAIVGGSGCGKTVLLEHLFGHHRPDEGQVLVADYDAPGAPLVDLSSLDDLEMDRIRVHWAVVFQHNALFSGTVYDNVALWLREIKSLEDVQIRAIARRVVTDVGLDPDDVLNKDRAELSGGMAKRIAVARALAMDPMTIFYDEPTTGLDPQHAAQIHDLIAASHRGTTTSGYDRTTIIVTHDKDLLQRLRPRVVMLHEGRIYFDGPFNQFERSRSPIVQPYFRLMPVLHLREPNVRI